VGNNIPEILPVLFIVGGLALAAIAAAVGWLLVEMTSSGAIACPACGRKTKHRYAVGRACEHCGADLAPWIIVHTGAT
jgi:predicted amidophosphoribosyltransferase